MVKELEENLSIAKLDYYIIIVTLKSIEVNALLK